MLFIKFLTCFRKGKYRRLKKVSRLHIQFFSLTPSQSIENIVNEIFWETIGKKMKIYAVNAQGIFFIKISLLFTSNTVWFTICRLWMRILWISLPCSFVYELVGVLFCWMKAYTIITYQSMFKNVCYLFFFASAENQHSIKLTLGFYIDQKLSFLYWCVIFSVTA